MLNIAAILRSAQGTTLFETKLLDTNGHSFVVQFRA